MLDLQALSETGACCVMGILNVTPDSFSDGGRFNRLDDALRQAERLLEEGADILDVGGESTRPGASAVSVDEELERVVPIIERLSSFPIPVSVDTSKPEVMRAAIEAGASVVNDVNGLRADGAKALLATYPEVSVCLMHMQGQPRTMQHNPHYSDVVEDIKRFLTAQVEACVHEGIQGHRLMIDPGIGFGKNLEHNLILLNRLNELSALELPILVGVSRKSMIGTILSCKTVEERVTGSVAAAVMAFNRGAKIFRVHDVKPTVEALKVAQCIARESNERVE